MTLVRHRHGRLADHLRGQLHLQHVLRARVPAAIRGTANGLEWLAPSPPGHGNFDFQPVVYRGPYEYGSPEVDTDYYPQIQPPPGRPQPIGASRITDSERAVPAH